jgi:tetratricopeptide (TPR) repeat protein
MADSGRLDELQRKFDENPRRYFAPLANEYRKGGDVERAIELCRTYLPHLPGHMSGYIVYGQALFDAKRGQEAAAIFQEALRIDPENVIALRHLGDIARMDGDRAAAIQWYEKVLELDPKNEEIAAYITELALADANSESEGESLQEAPATDEAANGEPQQTVEAAFEEVTFKKYAPYEYPDSDVYASTVAEPVAGQGDDASFDDAPPVSSTEVNEPVLEPADPYAVPDVSPEPSIPFATETLANLYVEQGLLSEALVVYRQLAETRDDPSLLARIQELEAKIAEKNAPAIRQRPAVTVRDFFAQIGTRTPETVSSTENEDRDGLNRLFASTAVDDADVRAAQSLADAYAGGSTANSSGSTYAHPNYPNNL